MSSNRLAKNDLLLLAALLLLGLAISLFLLLNRHDGQQVLVRVNGEIVAQLPLSEELEYPIEQNGAVTNVLRISDGAVRMIEANCPDHLCMRKGAVRYAGDSVVCLPNRVVLEISGADELDLDAVAG